MENKQQSDQSNVKVDREELLQSILNASVDEIMIIDKEYIVIDANNVVKNKAGVQPSQLTGRRCYEALYNLNKPCGAPSWECPLTGVLESRSAVTVSHTVNLGEKNQHLMIHGYPLLDSDGNIISMMEIKRDVSVEREQEAQLLNRKNQIAALHRIASAVADLRDLDTILKIGLDNVMELVESEMGGILLVNEKTRTLQYGVMRGLSPHHARELKMKIGEGIIGRVAQSGEPVVIGDVSKDPRTFRPDLVREDGMQGFASVPLRVAGKIIGVIIVSSKKANHFDEVDIELLLSIGDYIGTAIEQIHLYESLAEAGQKYQALLKHALTAQEQERKRIAREIHDETSQAITSLTLNLQALAGTAEQRQLGDAEFRQMLNKVLSYAVYAGNEIVKLMKELRPTLLDELGMQSAIHRYAKDHLQARGINLNTEFAGADRRFPQEVEVTLFRVAQGIIGNVLEHSEAKNAWVKLECDDMQCTMQISDDGKGFDPSLPPSIAANGRGAGQMIMKERIDFVGGVYQIDSAPGKGTSVTVSVPIPRGETHETN
ncbi:MAG TPA: GAF domain-containing protein [Dehalococcoidales bacterium]|nr:GAF domain-containing protein [Dehalococcoidales bacterium]